MTDFIVGQYYSDNCGNDYQVIEVDESSVTVRVGAAGKKKLRKILYCGVYAAFFNFNNNRILAEKIKPIKDAEIDQDLSISKNIINKNGETYVSLFKKHHQCK